MRLRPVVEVLDRRALKPAPGDEVLYENTPYIVTQVGMRWIHMYKKGDDRKVQFTTRIDKIIKVTAPPKEVAGGDDFLAQLQNT